MGKRKPGSVSLAKRAGLIIIFMLMMAYPVYSAQAYTAIEVHAQIPQVNYPPVMEPIGPQTVDEGQVLVIPVVVSNPDFGETYTYSITLANGEIIPEGIRLETTGDYAEFIWETTYYQAGTYFFNFSVTDGTFIAYQGVTITVVNVNGPPQILNPPQEPITLIVARMNKISLAVTDPDGDRLTCSVPDIPADFLYG